MKFYLIILLLSISALGFSQRRDSIAPKMLATFVYHPKPVKFHHRFRTTIRVHGSDELSDVVDNSDGLTQIIDEVLTDVEDDPVDAIFNKFVHYNLRMSYKTKNLRLKVYMGEDHMSKDVYAYYLGMKIKF